MTKQLRAFEVEALTEEVMEKVNAGIDHNYRRKKVDEFIKDHSLVGLLQDYQKWEKKLQIARSKSDDIKDKVNVRLEELGILTPYYRVNPTKEVISEYIEKHLFKNINREYVKRKITLAGLNGTVDDVINKLVDDLIKELQ